MYAFQYPSIYRCGGQYLIFGTNTGYIRVVRMPTEEEDTEEHHYITWRLAQQKLLKKLKGRRLAKEEVIYSFWLSHAIKFFARVKQIKTFIFSESTNTTTWFYRLLLSTDARLLHRRNYWYRNQLGRKVLLYFYGYNIRYKIYVVVFKLSTRFGANNFMNYRYMFLICVLPVGNSFFWYKIGVASCFIFSFKIKKKY